VFMYQEIWFGLGVLVGAVSIAMVAWVVWGRRH
jgi:hypothetical protein